MKLHVYTLWKHQIIKTKQIGKNSWLYEIKRHEIPAESTWMKMNKWVHQDELTESNTTELHHAKTCLKPIFSKYGQLLLNIYLLRRPRARIIIIKHKFFAYIKKIWDRSRSACGQFLAWGCSSLSDIAQYFCLTGHDRFHPFKSNQIYRLSGYSFQYKHQVLWTIHAKSYTESVTVI